MIQAIVLAIVQGVTEFLPISSSAHLMLVPWVMGWPFPPLLFDTMLHWGTLLAILIVFWRELIVIAKAMWYSLVQRNFHNPEARLGWYIVIGSIPVVIAGFVFRDLIEAMFHNIQEVGFSLIVTAGILALSEWLTQRRATARPLDQLTPWHAVAIGLGQALALEPGLSRSGMTIATGMAVGLRRDAAARFSFLLAIPAIFGAGMLQLSDALATDSHEVLRYAPQLIVGFVVSAVVGVLVIRFLLGYLRRHTLYIFSVYCLIVGISVLLFTHGGV
jgi:undecaprenyl-diphosphatase